MKQRTLKACLMASTLFGGLGLAAPAVAQDGADDRIIVTGSRIDPSRRNRIEVLVDRDWNNLFKGSPKSRFPRQDGEAENSN